MPDIGERKDDSMLDSDKHFSLFAAVKANTSIPCCLVAMRDDGARARP
jgi:hypothetical protein